MILFHSQDPMLVCNLIGTSPILLFAIVRSVLFVRLMNWMSNEMIQPVAMLQLHISIAMSHVLKHQVILLCHWHKLGKLLDEKKSKKWKWIIYGNQKWRDNDRKWNEATENLNIFFYVLHKKQQHYQRFHIFCFLFFMRPEKSQNRLSELRDNQQPQLFSGLMFCLLFNSLALLIISQKWKVSLSGP